MCPKPKQAYSQHIKLEPIKVTKVGITNFGIQFQCKGSVWFQQLMATEIMGKIPAKRRQHGALHVMQFKICADTVTRDRNYGITIGDNERPKSLNIKDKVLRKSTILLEIHISLLLY